MIAGEWKEAALLQAAMAYEHASHWKGWQPAGMS
jgi:hypothetical protein